MKLTLKRLGRGSGLTGLVVTTIALAVLIVLWIVELGRWLGWGVGIPLGLVTSPLALLLPFVLWAAQGGFPTHVFWLWLAGLLGGAVSYAAAFIPVDPPPLGPGQAANNPGPADLE